MKKYFLIICWAFMLSGIILSQESDKETDEVKKVISEAIDALSNTGDIESIEKHFHPGFELIVIKNNQLEKIAVYRWIENTHRKLKEKKYPPQDSVSIEFELVEITGNAAIAKFKYFKAGRQTCTDFMSLYKFDEGWRIVSQTTYHHQD